MSGDTIWRWFCTTGEAEKLDPAEHILEMRRRSGSSRAFEPVLIEDDSDAGLPDPALP